MKKKSAPAPIMVIVKDGRVTIDGREFPAIDGDDENSMLWSTRSDAALADGTYPLTGFEVETQDCENEGGFWTLCPDPNAARRYHWRTRTAYYFFKDLA